MSESNGEEKTSRLDGGPRSFVVASYNVHRCVGVDGRHDPDRVADVIRDLEADVVALQELDSRYHIEDDLDQIVYLATTTGYEAVPGPVRVRGLGNYGNGLLLRRPPRAVRRIDLSVRGREERGALDVDVDVDGAPAQGTNAGIRVVAAHLGLNAGERRIQVGRLLVALEDHRDRPLVLLGDFNEWMRGTPLLRRLNRRFGPIPSLRTFPSRFPMFALDRIWVQPRSAILELAVHGAGSARVASDHLPIRAVLDASICVPEYSARLARSAR